MKICIFAAGMVLPKGYRLCGSAKIAVETAHRLSERGYDIEGVTVSDPNSDIPSGLKMHIISQKMSIRHIPRLIRLLKRADPDVIHGFGELKTAILMAICKKILRKPTIVTITGDVKSKQNSRLIEHVRNSLLSSLDHIIFTSEHTKNTKTYAGIPEKKKSILHFGVEDIFLLPESRYKKMNFNNDKTILYFGDSLYERGFDTAIISFVEVLKKFEDAVLILAIRSYGHLQYVFCTNDKLSKLLFDLIGKGRIQILFQPYNQDIHISDIVSSSSIVILPFKHNPLEPPLTLLESMGMGKAVVTTHVGSNKEVINNFKNGVLVDPDEPSKLAEAIIHLLSNNNVRKEIGKQAQDYIKQNYTWDGYLEELSLIYEEVKRGDK